MCVFSAPTLALPRFAGEGTFISERSPGQTPMRPAPAPRAGSTGQWRSSLYMAISGAFPFAARARYMPFVLKLQAI